ncbi:MAG: hypothetical protein ACI8W8_000976 [Rhodothermales bacterium]|jgi:hypothetical protein
MATINKDELHAFILQVARESYSIKDWEKIAVNHYGDEAMETARRELVRHCLGYTNETEKKEPLDRRLLRIAADLGST